MSSRIIGQGKNNTTPPTLADGQLGDLQLDTRGNLRSTLVGSGTASAVATLTPNADALSGASPGLNTTSYGLVFNGATWDRMRSINASTDAIAGAGSLQVGPWLFNGATWDRLRGASAFTDGASKTGVLVNLPAGLSGTGTVDQIRTPNVIKTVAAVAITAGTGATIWTPAAGKKFRLMGWSLSVTVGASLIFGDNAVGTVILRTELLAAAGVSQTAPAFGNGFLSAAINNVLKLDVTVGATVSGYVFGMEE